MSVAQSKIGERRTRIRIERRSDAVLDALGQPQSTYSTLYTTWAKLVGKSGREVERGARMDTYYSYSAFLGFLPDISAKTDRVVLIDESSKVLEIVSVNDRNGMREELELLLTETGATA
jgi:head-tail adaptor